MSLRGKTIAVSISNAPDRERLGFPKTEVDRVLFSVCMGLIRAGARVLYAGNLEPSGYTFKIFRHLAGAYVTPDPYNKPFLHLIPRMVVKSMPRERFEEMLDESSPIAESQVLGRDGAVPATYDVLDEDDAENLSRVRRFMAMMSVGRVIMGGKMGIKADSSDAYIGKWPGVVEEAVYALERRQPVIALGAFGGAARDAAIALRLLPADLRVPRAEQPDGYREALERLTELAPEFNGEIEEQLKRLAREENSEAIAKQVPEVLEELLASPPDDERLLREQHFRPHIRRTRGYQSGNE